MKNNKNTYNTDKWVSIFDPFFTNDISDYYPSKMSQTLTGNTIPTGDNVRFNESVDGFVVEVDLPGVKKENTNLQITGDQIFISAERTIICHGGKREEIIKRSFRIHKDADMDSIDAKQCDGVLTITVKRKDLQKTKSKKIEIK